MATGATTGAAAATATGTGAGPRPAAAATAIAIAISTRATIATDPPRAPAPTTITTGAAAKPRARLRPATTDAVGAGTTTAAAGTATGPGASADRDPAVATTRAREAGVDPRRPSATGAPFVTAPALPPSSRSPSPSATGAPSVTAPGLPPGPGADRDRRRRNATGARFATAPDRRPATSATNERARPAARSTRGRGWRPLGQEGRPRSLPAGRPRRDRDGDRRPRLNLQKRSERAGGDGDDGATRGSSSLFGGARPRELALKEAGRDYRKEDAALSRGGVRRRESNEERALKADIAALAEKLGANPDDEALKSEISDKEDALAKLALELDDKVRFAQREEKARNEERGEGKDGRRESRREPRGDADRAGNWGEGKTDRQRNGGGGRGGRPAPDSSTGAKKEERKPREPRVMKVAEETGVKIASSSFAALALEEE